MARLATNFAAEQHRSLIDPTLRPLPDRSGGTAAQYRKTDSKQTITEPANISTLAKARVGSGGSYCQSGDRSSESNGVPPQWSGRGESRDWWQE